MASSNTRFERFNLCWRIMRQYPLIEKLWLHVHNLPVEIKTTYTSCNDFVAAYALEALLQNATVVYGTKGNMFWSTDKSGMPKAMETALLLAIEPIEQKKVTITRADLEKAFNKAVLGRGECIDHLIKELGL